MIGNVIQSQFLSLRDYPTAAALSFILMGDILVARAGLRAGARHRAAHRMSAVAVDDPSARPAPWPGRGRSSAHVLTVYAVLALGYLFLPIAVVIAFSFNNPLGRFNYTWQGFTFKNWMHPLDYPGLSSALRVSSRSRCSRASSRPRSAR